MDKIQLTRQHPLYQTMSPTWRLLLDVFEGTGGFLDGSYLAPHPREVEYAFTEDTTTHVRTYDYNTVKQETIRYKRRKALARYENFAEIILTTLLDYIYGKTPARAIGAAKGREVHPLSQWWENVDGEGTHINDWMKRGHLLAALFGHTFVVMDKPPLDTPPQSKAEQPDPFVRTYTPLDALDWIASSRLVTAIKFEEAVGRESLSEAGDQIQSASGSAIGDGARMAVQYRVWDGETWRLYDQDGSLVSEGAHAMGAAPVLVFSGRERATIPVVGRSVLGDPRLYKDHFNLVSEQRQLERDQTFSILSIELGQDQALEEAKNISGDTVGTSNALFSRGPAQFIAPDSGPVEHYERAKLALERTIYRLIGLPWDGDSREAETAESRRLKAMDLNRLLAGMAHEAERIDYGLARLWFIAQDGPEQGQAAFEASDLTIEYPDEFQTQEILDEIAELRAKLSASLGNTANRIIRERALPVLLPDLSDEDEATILEELQTAPVTAADASTQFRQDLLKATGQQKPGAQPVAEPGGPMGGEA